MTVLHNLQIILKMSAASESCEKSGDLQLPSKDKLTADTNLEENSTDNASSEKFGETVDDLDSIKDSMSQIEDDDDDAANEYILLDSCEEERSSLPDDQDQVLGSQESIESDDLHLRMSDGEIESQSETEEHKDEDTGVTDQSKNANGVQEQSETIDSSGCREEKSDQIPFEETLSCDLHINKSPGNSECSNDSSNLLKLTAEEEKIHPSANDDILDDDDDNDDVFQAKQKSKEASSELNSGDVYKNIPVETQILNEHSVESSDSMSSTKPISACQELQADVERPKESDSAEENPVEGLSNSNSCGSTELESRSVTETALNKDQVAVDAEVPSSSNGQQQSTVENSHTANSEVNVTEKHVDISSTLPCGLFKDDSLEEFSLSPKDCQLLNGGGENTGVEVNGLSETDQGMSIEDIIDNLSSPIGDDTTSNMADESTSAKGEPELEAEASPVVGERTNKRAPDPDSLSNDKVEVKKIKLDIVFNEITADTDPENSDEMKEVTSSTASVEEEKENIDVNGDIAKMDVVCDDDIDIIEEKHSENKEENCDEKAIALEADEMKVTVPKDGKPEVKVNGIITDHPDEDVKEEKAVHLTAENIDELVIKKISDKFYEDHINTVVALMKKIETLERNLEKSKKRLSYYQTVLQNLSAEHRRQLAKLGCIPKVHTRTVGVNVRILQEHELQSTNRLRIVKDTLQTPATSATQSPSATVLTNTTMQIAQAAAKKCLLPRTITPSNMTTGPRMPAPNVTVSQITVGGPAGGVGNEDNKIRLPSSMQIIPTVSQGMTNPSSIQNRPPRVQPSILRRQPVPKSPVTSTTPIVLLSNPPPNTSTIASSSSINVIDLTEDGDSSLTTTTVATSQSSAMLVSPSVTRGSSSNLVPMPLVGSLNSVVQIIPSGPHMSSSISGGNAIRMSQPPTVLPNSAGLPQNSRVAYVLQQNPGTIVMPRMDGQVRQIGNLQPHQSPFVTSPGHVRTILFQMNAPPSNPAPVVSSNAISTTKPTISQSSASVSLPSGNTSSSTMLISCVTKHPAPLPPAPSYPENKAWKYSPPKPALKISKVSNGIVLSWNMSLFNSHAEIASYQLFAYQESNQAVTSSLWKKVGDVKALPLPMACTLTQFVEGHRYHFAVRAVDIHGRIGPFSDPSSIVLLPRSGQIPPK